MRRTLVVGNWKMHGSGSGTAELVSGIVSRMVSASAEVAVCPPAVYIPLAVRGAEGSALGIGGQNCSEHAEGAYTGEVSAAMLADAGCRWVILGHSERRQYFGETDELVAARARAARTAGLRPILCVGETLEQREQGEAVAVVTRQLSALLAGLESTDVIAYEPVWAIGTGRTATPDQAQEMHACIRGYLREHVSDAAEKIRLLYGGSVKADNASRLFEENDIDGALVGGASLKVDEFSAIIAAARD
jgi:triosephosphate isomerase